ncbi:hypothetical protein GCM10012280_50270 [Wenjunlia tyrosinilytica]|uniref:Uncharacterized protein n=1 Tax=Wenjunlia tyrosinilytica TaxID=1544741 RepID=A0A918E114_9ACTN|nr:hypothetical protein GCM10012280_50270 [Wenjunlia tyrosinilytica]
MVSSGSARTASRAGRGSETERKNGWTLAETAGDTGPRGMQRLVNHYLWDTDALRDDVRDAVVGHIGDPQRGVLRRR